MVQLGHRGRWRGSEGDSDAGRRQERSKQNLLFLDASKTKMCAAQRRPRINFSKLSDFFLAQTKCYTFVYFTFVQNIL